MTNSGKTTCLTFPIASHQYLKGSFFSVKTPTPPHPYYNRSVPTHIAEYLNYLYNLFTHLTKNNICALFLGQVSDLVQLHANIKLCSPLKVSYNTTLLVLGRGYTVRMHQKVN